MESFCGNHIVENISHSEFLYRSLHFSALHSTFFPTFSVIIFISISPPGSPARTRRNLDWFVSFVIFSVDSCHPNHN